jgi:hypothetical protein
MEENMLFSYTLEWKAALLSTLRGTNSWHMYNFGSRKCRNDLNEVHTKNSWEKYIFKLEKYSFKLEKNIVLN